MKDKTEKLYDQERKELDLHRKVEACSMWSVGLVLMGLLFALYIIFIPLLIGVGPLAVLLGFCGVLRLQSRKKTQKGMGFAILGMVLGLIETAGGVLFVLYV